MPVMMKNKQKMMKPMVMKMHEKTKRMKMKMNVKKYKMKHNWKKQKLMMMKPVMMKQMKMHMMMMKHHDKHDHDHHQMPMMPMMPMSPLRSPFQGVTRRPNRLSSFRDNRKRTQRNRLRQRYNRLANPPGWPPEAEDSWERDGRI